MKISMLKPLESYWIKTEKPANAFSALTGFYNLYCGAYIYGIYTIAVFFSALENFWKPT